MRHRNSFISHWMLFFGCRKMENAQMIYTMYACPARSYELQPTALAETAIKIGRERERANTSTSMHRNVVLWMSVRTHKFSRCMQQRLNRFLFIYCASRSTAKIPKKPMVYVCRRHYAYVCASETGSIYILSIFWKWNFKISSLARCWHFSSICIYYICIYFFA